MTARSREAAAGGTRSPQQRCGAKPALLRGRDPSTGGLSLAALAGAQPEHKLGGLGEGTSPGGGEKRAAQRSARHGARPGAARSLLQDAQGGQSGDQSRGCVAPDSAHHILALASSPGFTARGDPGLQPSRTPCPWGWVVPTWEGTCRDRGAPPSLGQGPEAAAFGTSHGERTPASKPEQGGRGCSQPGQGTRWSQPEQAPATSMPPPVHAPGAYSYNTASSPGQAAAVLVCSCASLRELKDWGALPEGQGRMVPELRRAPSAPTGTLSCRSPAPAGQGLSLGHTRASDCTGDSGTG